MRAGCLLAFVALAGCGTANADPWQALEGAWTGAGTVRGMPAAIELRFRPALAGRGRHLRFRNVMRSEAGEHVFGAEALYLCDAGGGCRGHWYDSRGVVLPLSVALHADRVVVDWGDDASERGRTTYRPLGDDALEIIDEVRGADGTFKRFGETRARKRD